MLELPPVAADVVAKACGLTERRIQQLAKQDIIPRIRPGKYDLLKSMQAYIKYLTGAGAGDTLDQHGQKTRLLKAQADKAEIEAKRLAGAVIPADEVEAGWVSLVTMSKTRMLAVAPRAAPLVAVESEIDVCHKIIETLVYEAMAELAGTHVEIAGDAGDGDGGRVRRPRLDAAAKADGKRMGRSKPKIKSRSKRRAGAMAN